MYSRCGRMGNARKLFDEMPERNCFSWNTMTEGYMNSGDKESSLKLFDMMPERDGYSWNVVVSGFAKAGELGVARRLFDAMPGKDVVTLNSLLYGYSQNGYAKEALLLFKELQLSADVILMTTLLKACANLGALNCGKQIHARILIGGVECDSKMYCSLVTMYAKCGKVNECRRLFDRKSNRCVFLWDSMISGYVANNMETQALLLFSEMRNEPREDSPTMISVIIACRNLGLLETGKQMHGHAYKLGLVDDIVVTSTLLDMYSMCGSPMEACKLFSEVKTYDTALLNCMANVYFRCGRIDDAKGVFERIEKKSLRSWNLMTNKFSQNGCPVESFEYFRQMHKLDLPTDEVSLFSVISACASISFLELGEQAFARATIVGLDSDQVVSSSLIDLYCICKCGSVEHGRRVFDTMVKSDEVPWNSMISGYARNGHGFEAIELFKKMNVAGIRPTGSTFMGVLIACNHCGLVEEGRKLFEAMKLDNGFVPDREHFSCMVDLLARAGYLEEAVALVEEMPFDADASMWSSVLRGCVANGFKAMGKKAAEKIIELEPENPVAYVQLSAIFASSGDWESSALVRKLMREKHVKKNPGSSWADC